MDTQHIYEQLREQFRSEGIYHSEEQLNGSKVLIGYIKKFKWSWMATQLNTFIIVGVSEKKIDQAAIESFSSECIQYAIKNNKGWPRGLQSGIGSIAALIGEESDEAATSFCEKLSKKHWSAFEIPVLINSRNNTVTHFTNSPAWGAIYWPYLRKVIKTHLGVIAEKVKV